MKEYMYNLLRKMCANSKLNCLLPMDDMEEHNETLDNKNEGKQNMLIGNDEELRRNSKRAYLPGDILEMIMKRLKSTINQAIANKHCHPLPELPLVFLRLQRESVLRDMFFSFETTEQVFSIKSKNKSLLKRRRICHGMIEGWMILSKKSTKNTRAISFHNIVTNDVVMVLPPLKLPSQSPIPDRSHLNVGKMVASSSPKCEDCIVVGHFTDFAHIAYCRVNSNKSWTMIEANKEDTGNFYDLEICGGKLFVASDKFNNSMLVYDLQDSIDEPPKPKVLGMIPRWPGCKRSMHYGNHIHSKGNVIPFLTRGYASGELLLIYFFANFVYEAGDVDYMNVVTKFIIPPQITKCEVFKLDTSNDNNKWVKLDDLGDRVNFLENSKSLVMSKSSTSSMFGSVLFVTIQ